MKCLVTVGSTSFPNLVRACCENQLVLEQMNKAGIRELYIQHGSNYSRPPSPTNPNNSVEMKINYFDYRADLVDLIAQCSIIISHAGSGSILEALNSPSKPLLIVVPNTSLMDNHQMELSQRLRDIGHLILIESGISVDAISSQLNDLFQTIIKSFVVDNHKVENSLRSLFQLKPAFSASSSGRSGGVEFARRVDSLFYN